MKPAQILVLVVAGALSGVVITNILRRPTTPPGSAHAHATRPQPVPSSVAPPAAPGPAPVPVESAKPSPVAPVVAKAHSAPVVMARETHPPLQTHNATPIVHHAGVSKPHRVAMKMPPPPANPRPVILTARVEQPAPMAPAPARPAAAPAVKEAPVEAAPPARPEPEIARVNPAPPPQPAPNRVTLNAGLLFPVRLVDGLNSERNAPGDTFTGTLDHELVVDGWVIAERGARVEGRITSVDRGGKVKGTSSMAIELTRFRTSDGQTIPIQTDAFERQAEPSRQNDAAKIGGGAAIGAIIGAIAGGGLGAAIGAGVGGGAGASDVLLTRGKPVTFQSETRISFRLRTPVTITERK